MRRLLGVLVAAVGLGVLATSHGAFSAPPPPSGKQLICHVSNSSGAHIIEVSKSAVPAHLEQHGDCIINSTDRRLIGEECNPTDANNNDICDVQP